MEVEVDSQSQKVVKEEEKKTDVFFIDTAKTPIKIETHFSGRQSPLSVPRTVLDSIVSKVMKMAPESNRERITTLTSSVNGRFLYIFADEALKFEEDYYYEIP